MPYSDPAKNAAVIKEWHQKNRDKMRAYQRAWKARNAVTVREKERLRARERRSKEGPAFQMLAHAKSRARARGVPCTIGLEDIIIPDACPVFGTPLRRNVRAIGPDSPTLDCVIPSLGYVPGNVCVISFRANKLKSSMTLAELLEIKRYIEGFSRGD